MGRRVSFQTWFLRIGVVNYEKLANAGKYYRYRVINCSYLEISAAFDLRRICVR